MRGQAGGRRDGGRLGPPVTRGFGLLRTEKDAGSNKEDLHKTDDVRRGSVLFDICRIPPGPSAEVAGLRLKRARRQQHAVRTRLLERDGTGS